MANDPLRVIDDKSKPWYKEGLRFSCTGCGKCCTGSPGYVWLTKNEMAQMADHLNLNLQEFVDRYVRLVHGRYSLRENPASYDCIFLENKTKCAIYSVRPAQCRTFPFWQGFLESAEDWEKAAEWCEGIQQQAPIVSFETIQKQLAIQEGESR